MTEPGVRLPGAPPSAEPPFPAHPGGPAQPGAPAPAGAPAPTGAPAHAEAPAVPARTDRPPVSAGPRHPWRGVIAEYRDRLPVDEATPVVTLREGGTPLLPAPVLSARTGCDVYLKVEGANPTGSFKDRGMTSPSAPPPGAERRR